MIATLGAMAFSLRYVWYEPAPLWVPISLLLAYLCLLFLGVMVPRLEMFADIVWRGPKNRPEVALTFDDGPHVAHTSEVLQILERRNTVATFFVIGWKAARHPDILRAMLAQGHAIGIHGYQHDRYLGLRSKDRIVRDLAQAIDVVERITGQRPWLYRPAVGQVSPTVARACEQLGLTIVGWSARGFDGLKKAQPRRVAARIISDVRPGAIVLLHDAAEVGDRKPAGVDALEAVLAAIDDRALRAVLVQRFVDKQMPVRESQA